jgi:NAD(P)-dependent dehydrogenase (short-subunit alcohol dehydrogenase family)
MSYLPLRIIIAGGATVIGAATAKLLESQEDARVVIGDINYAGASAVAEGIRSSGNAAWAVHFDLADEASIHHLIAAGFEYMEVPTGL